MIDWANADVVVVGAGFFGATIAERCATLGLRVVVLEQRNHIGGNCYSEVHAETGIEVHKYGSHVFHTPSKAVWDYIRTFGEFTDYRHQVFTVANGRVFPMPINMATMCEFFGRHLTPSEARSLIAAQSSELNGASPRNFEEKAISLVGRPLYEALIRGYTAKQWETAPLELPPSIISRLPVRYNFDNRYFSDPFEGLPLHGYTAIFKEMLTHDQIRVHLGVNFFDVRKTLPVNGLVVYTGPIDRYFEYRAGALRWRTVDLEFETIGVGDFQGTSVMNYADDEVPFTRIHEFRHLHPERTYPTDLTVVAREYSRFAGREDEPFYPISTPDDQRIYSAYRQMSSASERNVIFGGRLGTYRYLDMHQAIGAALRTFDNEIIPRFS